MPIEVIFTPGVGYTVEPIEAPVGEGLPGGGTSNQVLALDGSLDPVWVDAPPASLADDSVTAAKLADMASKTYLGRSSGGTGNPEGVPVATLKVDLALAKTDVGLSNVDNTSDATVIAAAKAAAVVNNMTASTTEAPSKTAVSTAIAAVVANDLTASTTVAPSKTAVNTAISTVTSTVTALDSVVDTAVADLVLVEAAIVDLDATKAPLLASVDISAVLTLTSALHANRGLYIASGTAATDRDVSTSGSVVGDFLSGRNNSSNTQTFTGFGVATPGSGLTNACPAGWPFSFEFDGTNWRSNIINLSAAAPVLAAITGTTPVGSTLTCVPSSGYSSTSYQWKNNGTNISGETSATYVTVSGDAGDSITCLFAGLYTTNAIVPTAVSAGRTDNFNRTNSSTLGTPSDGGSAWTVPAGDTSWAIVSNRAEATTHSIGYCNILSTGLTNQQISFKAFTTASTTQGMPAGFNNTRYRIYARYTDASNHVYAEAYANGASEVWKTIGGTATKIADVFGFFNAGAELELRLKVVGQSITFQNRQPVTTTRTNTSAATGGWDDISTATLGVGELTSGTTIGVLMYMDTGQAVGQCMDDLVVDLAT